MYSVLATYGLNKSDYRGICGRFAWAHPVKVKHEKPDLITTVGPVVVVRLDWFFPSFFFF